MKKRRMIPVAEPEIGEEELKLATEAIKSGWVSSRGKFIAEFEEKFAGFCGTDYAVTTSNGTTALHLILDVLGIGSDEEVIVPTLTFIATANAVTYTGAKPVFVDSASDIWNLDVSKIKEKITPKTKAIIPVHLFGHPAEMKEILELAEEHDLFVIEDAAEAHGAEYSGKRVGSLGDAGIFSFYGNKIITTGEGGMIVTNDKNLAARAKILRDHGMSPEKRYWHSVVGYNYRMTNVQAAIGVAQMGKINYFIERKREISKAYNSLFDDIPEITIPPENKNVKNVYWMYTILLKDKIVRDKVRKYLKEKGIDTRPFFYPIHTMPSYKSSINDNEKFPMAEDFSGRGLMLPSSVSLTTEEISFIGTKVSEFIEFHN